jgi:hypothetical protein
MKKDSCGGIAIKMMKVIDLRKARKADEACGNRFPTAPHGVTTTSVLWGFAVSIGSPAMILTFLIGGAQ